MNKEQFEGNWNKIKGMARKQFAKLTDDDIQMIKGKRDVMIGRLQERYGVAREEAEKKLAEFEAKAKEESTSEER